MANALGSALTTYWQNLTMDRPEYYNLTANEWVVTGRLDLDTGRNFTSWMILSAQQIIIVVITLRRRYGPSSFVPIL